jgi:mRNA interferase RelE/StbE
VNSGWKIELSDSAERALRKLDRQSARRIAEFIDTRLNGTDNPRRIGKALQAALGEYWSYRVGDYRLICELRDASLRIVIIKLGHRSDVYR